jgi:hypothetical protein
MECTAVSLIIVLPRLLSLLYHGSFHYRQWYQTRMRTCPAAIQYLPFNDASGGLQGL